MCCCLNSFVKRGYIGYRVSGLGFRVRDAGSRGLHRGGLIKGGTRSLDYSSHVEPSLEMPHAS